METRGFEALFGGLNCQRPGLLCGRFVATAEQRAVTGYQPKCTQTTFPAFGLV